ncbi:hypothetical protein VSH64_14430 [Amycolatopsis rhabdoformis]|uniref:Winged helix DNA-binding domain-containing protein n=1 Tax=Amycolatopsis rhabdoformis TaxID=1448059 RepID=A0ABZ1IHP0_9PSEU|nr:hypothetical protein [Amycolatopsis rhabdoformis]WSE33296.1 hypothetical protein VSH64_14430 [Amycolatopsis rhabdoformis]
MSLTSELADPASVLTSWCARVFTGTAAVAAQVEAAVQDVRPVRPAARDVPRRHWAEIGGAFGQRVADLVQPAPPYYALLGLVAAQWATGTWAHGQAAAYPTHLGLPDAFRARALGVRPAATTWLDLGDQLGGAVAEPPPWVAEAFTEFFDRARAYQGRHAPAGTLGPPGVEAGLARTNWVVSACEDVYRSGGIDPRLARIVDGGAVSAAALRGLATDGQVSELAEIAKRLHDRGALWELRRRAGNPPDGEQLGLAGPTIVPGWADGDVLLGAIDPAGGIGSGTATLLDVKTVVGVRDPDRVGRWLWQLLLYAWLDVGDLYRIREVGLLLARHGTVVAWPLEQLEEELLGTPDVIEFRRDEARGLVGAILASAGLAFPES